jgi:hypothetical protein
MKRFLIFLLVGPSFGVTLVSAAMALASELLWWPIFASLIVQDAKTYIVIMTLLVWLSDVVLVHWEVQRRVRMIVLGGGVVFLTTGLQRYATMILVAALICGAVAAFCVWLSDRVVRGVSN